jgi:uncharacterized membrane protein YphA (DoxX/SURF4 family)
MELRFCNGTVLWPKEKGCVITLSSLLLQSETMYLALLVRVLFGANMAIYGYPKLTNAGRTASIMKQLGVPAIATYLTMILQFFGGLFLIVGLIVPIVATFFAISMVADTIFKKIKMEAPYIKEGSPIGIRESPTYENDILYLLLSIVMIVVGGGFLSLDNIARFY